MSLFFQMFLLGILTTGCMESCTEQHNPRPTWDKYSKEREAASAQRPQLTEKGELPAPPSADAPAEEASTANADAAAIAADGIKAKYVNFCGSCHGATGQADGPAALALNPKPRNLSDADWQKSVTDEHIYKVIKDGGTAVGLSASMAPWGAILKEDELQAMVALVRSFGQ
jgi:mono/diheme cytochrome c family protein